MHQMSLRKNYIYTMVIAKNVVRNMYMFPMPSLAVVSIL